MATITQLDVVWRLVILRFMQHQATHGPGSGPAVHTINLAIKEHEAELEDGRLEQLHAPFKPPPPQPTLAELQRRCTPCRDEHHEQCIEKKSAVDISRLCECQVCFGGK